MRSSDWSSDVCSSDLNDPQLPSQKKKERHWRTRADPLEPFWPRVEELLQIDGIIPVTVFETLQDEFGEDAVSDAIRRTLERRIARSLAMHGGEKEIFFPQYHESGRQGVSAFTVCDRSEEHTFELQSLMSKAYAVCGSKKAI